MIFGLRVLMMPVLQCVSAVFIILLAQAKASANINRFRAIITTSLAENKFEITTSGCTYRF